MKLNMGCGSRTLDGYVNVDKWDEAADVRWDLEVAPWPWPDSSAQRVVFNHSLEHMGGTPESFLAIMQELYRVCAPDAEVRIVVPHPRHDNFIGDPTHVRAVTPQLLQLFDRDLNDQWKAQGGANSRLAHLTGVDFQLVQEAVAVDEPYWSDYQAGTLAQEDMLRLLNTAWNVAREITMTLKVRKPA